MAQLLYERHSTNVHLNIVKRHIRLARQFKGAEELVIAIEPFYNELAAKAANTISTTEETECKRDLLALADVSLDDKVRDLNDACKKYDRDHPGIPVSALLFPEGTSPFIYAPIETEPTLVEKLILGIQSLGEGHPLAEHIGTLQDAIGNSKTAIAEVKNCHYRRKNGRSPRSHCQSEFNPAIRTKHLYGQFQIRKSLCKPSVSADIHCY